MFVYVNSHWDKQVLIAILVIGRCSLQVGPSSHPVHTNYPFILHQSYPTFCSTHIPINFLHTSSNLQRPNQLPIHKALGCGENQITQREATQSWGENANFTQAESKVRTEHKSLVLWSYTSPHRRQQLHWLLQCHPFLSKIITKCNSSWTMQW